MKEKIKAIFCVLFGHSKIQTTFFGYFYCGRCGVQVGDSLGGYYVPKEVVIVGHNCKKCRANYKKCTWKDKFMVKNPFVKVEG